MDWLRDWSDVPAYALGMMGILLLLADRRRRLVLLLAVQYVLASWSMLGAAQPVSAGAILLTGILSSVIFLLSLWSTDPGTSDVDDPAFPSNVLLRLSVGVLGVLASIGALRAQIVQLSTLDPIYVLGAYFILFSGIMQLGLTRSPLRVGIGLLSVLTGFTVVYVALEPSLAVVALLALVHLGIALTCSYVLIQIAPARPSGEQLN